MLTTSYLFAGNNAEVVPTDAYISKAYAGQGVKETVIYPSLRGVGDAANQIVFYAVPLGADGATVLVEHTLDDPFGDAPITWLANAALPATVITAAAPFQGNYFVSGVRALRFSVTGGAAKISVGQNV